MTKQDLLDYFYQFGEIRTVNMLARQKAAFVHFTNRDAAEKAAEAAHSKLVIKGRPLKIMWGRANSQQKGDGAAVGGVAPLSAPVLAAAPFMPPAPPGMGAVALAAPAAGRGRGGGGGGAILYPSMDPQRLGARTAVPVKGAHEKGPHRK